MTTYSLFCLLLSFLSVLSRVIGRRRAEQRQTQRQVLSSTAESGCISGLPGALAQPPPDRLTDVALEKKEEEEEDEEDEEEEEEEVTCYGPHRPEQKLNRVSATPCDSVADIVDRGLL